MNAAVCHVSHEGRSILATVAPWILGGPPSKCDLDDVVNRRQSDSDSAAWLRMELTLFLKYVQPQSLPLLISTDLNETLFTAERLFSCLAQDLSGF
jgi:hypothetical protein